MEPTFDEAEARALYEYMMSGGWVTEFVKTREFETEIANFVGAKHAMAVNNGTVALCASLLAVGVGPGDEVIVPDLTMIASANCATLIGARPVLVDVEPQNLCLNTALLKGHLSEKTKAVIHVSFNGRTNDLTELKRFCNLHKLFLIEDAAQSLGSYFRNAHLGTIGDLGTFSFSALKIITTGQGGIVVTQSDNLATRLRKIKDFGRLKGGEDIHDSLGYNFKFTDIQAVLGLEQMKKLESRIRRKKEIYALYRSGLQDIEAIEWVPTDLSQTTPWFIDIFVDDPNDLLTYLRQHHIGTRLIYPPIHTQKAYQVVGNFPVAERFAQRGLWLPSSIKLTDGDISYICDAIAGYFKKK